jgi:hypothetical protein
VRSESRTAVVVAALVSIQKCTVEAAVVVAIVAPSAGAGAMVLAELVSTSAVTAAELEGTLVEIVEAVAAAAAAELARNRTCTVEAAAVAAAAKVDAIVLADSVSKAAAAVAAMEDTRLGIVLADNPALPLFALSIHYSGKKGLWEAVELETLKNSLGQTHSEQLT